MGQKNHKMKLLKTSRKTYASSGAKKLTDYNFRLRIVFSKHIIRKFEQSKISKFKILFWLWPKSFKTSSRKVSAELSQLQSMCQETFLNFLNWERLGFALWPKNFRHGYWNCILRIRGTIWAINSVAKLEKYLRKNSKSKSREDLPRTKVTCNLKISFKYQYFERIGMSQLSHTAFQGRKFFLPLNFINM